MRIDPQSPEVHVARGEVHGLVLEHGDELGDGHVLADERAEFIDFGVALDARGVGQQVLDGDGLA